jgi:hypothetical protein
MRASAGLKALLPLAATLALLPCPAGAALDEAAFEKALASPSLWRTPDFAKLWQRDAADAGAALARGTLAQPAKVFGLTPVSITSRFLPDHQVHSISIVVLDAGAFFGFGNSNLPQGESFDAAKQRFDSAFNERKQLLIAGLQSLPLQPDGAFNPGERSGLKLTSQMWSGGGAFARVLARDHQLLQVDFFRTAAESKSLLALPPAPQAKRPASALPPTSTPTPASPERRITGIPMIPQGNRGYCGVAILAMIGAHFGLTPGAEEMAAANGFVYGMETNPDIREMFTMIAKEAGVKAQRSPKFDLASMKRAVDAGLPMVVFRRWAQERDYIHSTYSAQIARGMQAELPQPGMEDRKSWPGKDAPAHASIVNGYRDDKREVVFTESWGQQARNRRMRYEEMEATSYYAVYFSR